MPWVSSVFSAELDQVLNETERRFRVIHGRASRDGDYERFWSLLTPRGRAVFKLWLSDQPPPKEA